MRRKAIFALAGSFLSPAVLAVPAEALELDLPGPAERQVVAYACSDGVERSAEYVNLPGNGLALIEIDGVPLLFVNVLSGSGAKYVSGSYIWWTKGSSADLSDITAGEDAAPTTCSEKTTP